MGMLRCHHCQLLPLFPECHTYLQFQRVASFGKTGLSGGRGGMLKKEKWTGAS